MTQRSSELYVALSDDWREKLAVLEHELPSVLSATEVEALHRCRVALRRTRSLLKLFRPLLPEGEWQLDQLYAEFGWFGEVTGAVRDLDVMLLAVRDRCGDEQQCDALQPLIARLEAQHASARRNLQRAVRSARLRRLLSTWRQFVEVLPQCKAPPPLARVKLKIVFRVRLLKLARWLLKHGSRIDADTPATELHRLRIRAKRLRYLLDAFPGQLPKRVAKPLHRELVKLQDLLGAHQDAVATTERLQQLRTALDDLTPEAAQAIDNWLRELEQIKRQARDELPALLLRFGESCMAL